RCRPTAISRRRRRRRRRRCACRGCGAYARSRSCPGCRSGSRGRFLSRAAPERLQRQAEQEVGRRDSGGGRGQARRSTLAVRRGTLAEGSFAVRPLGCVSGLRAASTAGVACSGARLHPRSIHPGGAELKGFRR
ncbi:unnamed protein product, partial [Ectocarpus sp. 8 AP-2014]